MRRLPIPLRARSRASSSPRTSLAPWARLRLSSRSRSAPDRMVPGPNSAGGSSASVTARSSRRSSSGSVPAPSAARSWLGEAASSARMSGSTASAARSAASSPGRTWDRPSREAIRSRSPACPARSRTTASRAGSSTSAATASWRAETTTLFASGRTSQSRNRRDPIAVTVESSTPARLARRSPEASRRISRFLTAAASSTTSPPAIRRSKPHRWRGIPPCVVRTYSRIAPARLGRVLHLLRDRHLEARVEQLADVARDRVVRDPAHRRRDLPVVTAFGQDDAQDRRGLLGILEEQLVEVAEPVQQHGVLDLRLELEILLQHRCLLHASGIVACRAAPLTRSAARYNPRGMKQTPMLQQYLELKAQVEDAVLLYRLGDFYELFFEDAEKASPILGIVLTKRRHNGEVTSPMCGIPHHAVASYVGKLLDAGLKVAIAEQVEDPAKAGGLVRREVIRVLTPGTVTEPELLGDGERRWIAAH